MKIRDENQRVGSKFLCVIRGSSAAMFEVLSGDKKWSAFRASNEFKSKVLQSTTQKTCSMLRLMCCQQLILLSRPWCLINI